jgi:flotillin
VQDLYKGVLPINELAKSVGLNLPSFLATPGVETPPVVKLPERPTPTN